ncbi:inositol monophosphatase [Rickenella mellea]|uniref:Inositol-1-monophosphatase n=1 Tax=Rickenella mellea TaxID=50990 RepID=A0A4Y7Q1A0_9AGAM|nr:inositol monophosphatase [Rickenella mellea]
MTTIDISSADLKQILTFCIDLAREAGKTILKGSEAILSTASDDVEEKKNSVDLVTEYDRQVEALVRDKIKQSYPDYAFVGEEETSALGTLPPLTDGPTFCVDPIDGTTNFIHGFPYVCISIGLVYKKRAVLGVIYNPMLDWLYYGVESQGSYLLKSSSSAPLKLPLAYPRHLPSLSNALIAVEWGSDRTADSTRAKSESFARLAGDGRDGQVKGGVMAHSLRSVGSAALNFAAVASGSLDLYWEIGCWPWDVAAGIVIAQEAGGLVSTSDLSLQGGEVTGDSSDTILTGRKYVVIRGIADTPNEKGGDAQKRLVKDFCNTIVDMKPARLS